MVFKKKHINTVTEKAIGEIYFLMIENDIFHKNNIIRYKTKYMKKENMNN